MAKMARMAKWREWQNGENGKMARMAKWREWHQQSACLYVGTFVCLNLGKLCWISGSRRLRVTETADLVLAFVMSSSLSSSSLLSVSVNVGGNRKWSLGDGGGGDSFPFSLRLGRGWRIGPVEPVGRGDWAAATNDVSIVVIVGIVGVTWIEVKEIEVYN